MRLFLVMVLGFGLLSASAANADSDSIRDYYQCFQSLSGISVNPLDSRFPAKMAGQARFLARMSEKGSEATGLVLLPAKAGGKDGFYLFSNRNERASYFYSFPQATGKGDGKTFYLLLNKSDDLTPKKGPMFLEYGVAGDGKTLSVTARDKIGKGLDASDYVVPAGGDQLDEQAYAAFRSELVTRIKSVPAVQSEFESYGQDDRGPAPDRKATLDQLEKGCAKIKAASVRDAMRDVRKAFEDASAAPKPAEGSGESKSSGETR